MDRHAVRYQVRVCGGIPIYAEVDLMAACGKTHGGLRPYLFRPAADEGMRVKQELAPRSNHLEIFVRNLHYYSMTRRR
jgi:hypothetical protein